jgi:WD40 repeat protein
VSTEAAPQPPVIPDYELLRLIGRGAYGEVWLARGVTGVYRAVKLVWRDRFPEAGPYEREFHGLKEFAAISLSESRQLALLHVGRDPAAAYFYYVMELADDVTTGRDIDPANYTPHTLKEMRSRRGRLPAGECVSLGVELARALSGLHGRGLVHRDIKPSNVIIVGGAPKLADIGLVTEASAALTFVGTEGFVPPEGPGAPGADVFALGKLLYELVTGLDRHDYPRLPPELHAWSDRKEVLELNEVLIRACEPHPDQRHLDAAALLDDLLLLQAGKSVRQLRKAERRLARALKIAAVLALIAGVAGLGAYIERQRANEEMAGRLAAEAERDTLRQRKVYISTVGDAQNAIQQEAFGLARQLLEEARPRDRATDWRGFEWAALWRAAQGDHSMVLRPDGPAIQSLAVSPDQGLLAASSTDRTTTLYDLATRTEVRKVAGPALLGGFSADGRWLVGSDAQRAVQRWRVADGSADGEPQPIADSRVIGPAGNDAVMLIRSGNPPALVVWDFARRATTLTLPLAEPAEGARWEYFRSGLARDGRQVALAWVRGRGNQIRFRLTHVDLRGVEPRLVHTELAERPGVVGVDDRGAWALLDDTGQVWRNVPAGAAWQPAGETLLRGIRRLVSTGQEGTPRVAADREGLFWFDATGQVVRRGRGHQGIVGDVAATDSGWIFSASHNGELRAWPPDTAAAPKDSVRLWNSRASATGVVYSEDGRQLAVPLDGQNCAILDLSTLAQVQTVPGLRFPLWWQGDLIAGIAADGHGLLIVSLTGRQPGRRIFPQSGQAWHGLVSNDGRKFALTDADGALWRESASPVTGPLLPTGYRNRYAVVADSGLNYIWSAGTDNHLRCVSLDDGREIWAVALPALSPTLKLMPGHQLILVPLENGRVELRDARTGALLRSALTGSSTPQAVEVTADGRRVFVAGSKGDIACVETTDWSRILTFHLPDNEPLHALNLAPDGRTLAAITKTGWLHLIRTD